MTDSGIRWIQRFHNFQLALAQLNDAVLLSKERELSLLEKPMVCTDLFAAVRVGSLP